MKSNRAKIYILVIVLLVVLVAILDSGMPKRINWSERYSTTGTFPYDVKVLSDQLRHMKDWQSFTPVTNTFYEYAEEQDRKKGNGGTVGDSLYLFVGSEFSIDKESESKLLAFVKRGNDAFISANVLGEKTLAFMEKYMERYHTFDNTKWTLKVFSGNDSLLIDKPGSKSYIVTYDSTVYYGLGYFEGSEDTTRYINFIRVPYGKGNIYLHSMPIAFTNYYLLKGTNSKYTERVLSVSNKHNLVFHINDTENYRAIDDHILQYILKNPPLRWAWYICLLSLLLFIIFNAKRKQRVIPVIQPLENTTVGFTKTISNLFYEIRDHQYIINKRMIYFLEHIRNRYHIDTTVLDTKFTDHLSMKSGVSVQVCKDLVSALQQLQKASVVSEQDLVQLDKLLEQFQTEEYLLKKNRNYDT